MSELPEFCAECGRLKLTQKDRDISAEMRKWRRKYNRLRGVSAVIAENFQLYESNINVVVAVDLIENLQRELDEA